MDATKKLPTLWYENDEGDRWIPPEGGLVGDETRTDIRPPPGFIYQRTRFPRELHDSAIRCDSDGASPVIFRGTSSWPGDLVLALARPSLREMARAIVRYGSPGPRFTVEQAILRAAGCERCMNTLAHRIGLRWGYRKNGKDDNSRTRCEACTGTCDHDFRDFRHGRACSRCGEFDPASRPVPGKEP